MSFSSWKINLLAKRGGFGNRCFSYLEWVMLVKLVNHRTNQNFCARKNYSLEPQPQNHLPWVCLKFCPEETWHLESSHFFLVSLFIHVNFLALYFLIKKSSWSCWRLIIIRYASIWCRNHWYQPIPGFQTLKWWRYLVRMCFFFLPLQGTI